ncbi:MAG: 6,7-dimethyl-8-ribityllumazine synthase [Alphaproteobacteria bacterium]|nr:6,7-dimethyl-8-ribityllumazine synthase [Alphaproteobacteria bacterium]
MKKPSDQNLSPSTKANSSALSGALSGLSFDTPPHVLILEARFYDEINDLLLAGAQKFLEDAGCSYEVITVPGALELPSALNFAATAAFTLEHDEFAYDAYVVLGCVIRGETTHYELVSENCVRGIMDVSLGQNLAVGNGVLTVENVEQAMERADPERLNKGAGAAEAALRMLKIAQKFGVSSWGM